MRFSLHRSLSQMSSTVSLITLERVTIFDMYNTCIYIHIYLYALLMKELSVVVSVSLPTGIHRANK